MPSILLLGPSLSAVSGVSTHINQLMGSSLAANYRLLHFQVGSEGRQEGKAHKIWRFMFSPFALAAKIISESPDIVHLNTSLEQKAFWRDAVYFMIAKICQKKVVYQVHGGDLPQQFFKNNRFFSAILRCVLSGSEAVVLLASVERDAYQQFACFKSLSIIANAIDLDAYRDQTKRPMASELVHLGYIGRLAHNKGVFESIEAINLLHKSGDQQFTLTIAGSGPAELDLREQVKALGLDNVVCFSGALFGQQKMAFWQQTDIFVFPTFHREGLPYTVLESLASGTPMVTTRVGGISDVIKDGVHGIFVEPHDAAGVAAAIKRMTDDRIATQRMAAKCVARAREFYSVERLASQFNDLYQSILS